MENFTKNFTYDELIKSTTAEKLGLDNTPNSTEKEKLRQLAVNILQPIRDALEKPIKVNSAYRSEKVNKAVGGVSNSQHRLGEAADLTLGSKEKNKQLFELISKLIKNKQLTVGQLINEYSYAWIHVSLPRVNKKNNQIFSIG